MPSPVIQISSNYAMNHVENTDGSYEYQGSATGIQIAFLAVTTGSGTITVTLPALVPIAPSYAPIGTQSWTVTVRKVDSGSGAIKLVTPDGTEIDAGYAQWHSDGTEINVSGLRSPLTGDVCLGEWKRTGARSYQLNHFGVSYDSTGVNLVGPARIQQWLTLDEKGNATSGKFTIDQWDESGTLLAHIQGTVTGTRVTMETGFEKVE